MRARLMIAALVVAVLAIGARDVSEGMAGEGFTYRSVSFSQEPGYKHVYMIGEMENTNGQNYSIAIFDVTLYDARDDVLAVGKFTIRNFKGRSKRPIKTKVKTDLAKIAGYKIDYNISIEE